MKVHQNRATPQGRRGDEINDQRLLLERLLNGALKVPAIVAGGNRVDKSHAVFLVRVVCREHLPVQEGLRAVVAEQDDVEELVALKFGDALLQFGLNDGKD